MLLWLLDELDGILPPPLDQLCGALRATTPRLQAGHLLLRQPASAHLQLRPLSLGFQPSGPSGPQVAQDLAHLVLRLHLHLGAPPARIALPHCLMLRSIHASP